MSFDIRILYVDDNPLDRELVRDALAQDPVNFRLTEAASRAEFEAQLAPGRYDLVLSDFNILGYQGLQVLAAVKAVDPQVPVVIVTGTGSEETAVEAMKRGAADYVIKDPRHIQRLPQTLRLVLEQARQRQATLEATARYRELFRSVPVALYRFTLDGEVFFANPAFHQMMGLPEQERVLHLQLAELFHTPAELAAWLMRLEREGLVRGFEAQLRRRDGTLIWTRGHARAVRDEHFQVLYCEGSLEDITEQKAAEAALRESEARYRLLAEHMADVIWVIDLAADRFAYISPSVEALLGYTAAEILAQPATQSLAPASQAVFAAALAQRLPAFQAGEAGAATAVLELEQVRADGSTVWVEVSTSLVRDQAGQVQLVGVTRDLTDRRRAQAERQTQEARYKLALEGADLGTWDWDVTSGRVIFNARWCEMLGYTLAEVPSDLGAWESLLHPDDRPAVMAALQAHLAGQAPAYETEHRLRHRSGEWRWILDRGRVLERDAAGQPLRMCGTHLDITERRQADAARQASEQRYRQLVERVPAVIYRFSDRRGGIYYSPYVERLLGWSPDELYAQPRLWHDAIDPADQPRIDAAIRAFEAGGSFDLEYRLRARDGRWVWLQDRSIARQQVGDEVIIEGLAVDITERRQAEAALRYQASLVDNVSDAVISTDADFNIVSWNPAAEKTYGWTAAEAAGQPITLFVDQARDGDGLAVRRAALQAAGFWRGEIPHVRKDGVRLNVQVSVTAVRGLDGRLLGTIAINRDITELKRADAVQRRYQLLREHARDIFLFIRVADGTILEANQAALEAYGYTADEIRQRRLHDLREPSTVPAIPSQIAQARQGGAYYETVHRRRDGGLFPAEVQAFSAVLDGEEILVNVIRDLSERRQTEAALRASEARYRDLVEAQADVVMRADRQYRITFVNQAFCRTFGVEAARVLGQPVLAHIPAADQAAVLARLQALDQPPYQTAGENRNATLAGERWFAWVNTAIRDETGQVVEFQMVGRDITERRQVEAELHLQSAALAATANAIVITDPEGVIQWVNPAFTALTGYAVEEVRGQNPRLLKSGQHLAAFYRAMWETVKAGQIWHGELINRRRDGRLYDEEQTITPVLDAAGRIQHFVAIKQNITPRKQRERELESIAQVSAALRAAAGWADMPPIILDQVARLLQARGAALALPEAAPAGRGQRIGHGQWVDFTGLSLPPDEAVMRHVLETGQPYVCEDVRTDPRFYQTVTVTEQYAVACVPLMTQQTAIGVLWAAREWPFLEAELQVLAAIADISASALHRAALHEQTTRRLQQLQALRQVDQAITSTRDIHAALNSLLEQAASQLGVNAADVLRLNPHRQTLEYVAGRGFTGEPYTAPLTLAADCQPAQAVLERRLVHIPDLAVQPLAGQRGAALAEERLVTYLAVPLIVQEQVKGVLELFHRSPCRLEAEQLELLEMFAGQAAIALENAELFQSLQHSNAELRQAYDATIEGWSRALDMRDKETEGHTRRVTELTLRLARTMGLSGEALVHIRRGALLHDIGKMGVPDGILLKPGPLTEEEWGVMRQHPQYAYEMLEPIAFLRPALEIPFCHHEKWDGTGYPRGLAAEAIPLAARIFAVIDVWDALSADRPYRLAWPAARIRDYIQAEAGRQFDPRVVAAFLKLAL